MEGRHLWTKRLSSDPLSREGQANASCSRGGPWLSVRLKPLRRFQSRAFARAHRISAWSHVRARLPLGKADISHRLSEAELNRPPRPRGPEEACTEMTPRRRSGGARSRACLKYCRSSDGKTRTRTGHEDRTGVGAVITTRTDALLIGQG